MAIEKNFKEAKQLIDESHNILLTMHERMDGDDGGALLAMGIQLEKLGKQINCAIKQGVPPNLKFLPFSNQITDDIKTTEFDLLITFGCSNLNRTGNPKILNLKSKILNIDHHPDNQNFGTVNIVDAHKSSVAELIYDFFIFHRWPITADIATCLLTGIVTDTGCFQHSNTQSSTLRIAGELMNKGAILETILENTTKNKNLNVLTAWGKTLANLHYDSKNQVIYSIVTKAELGDLTQLPAGAFEGITETLNTFPEAKFAMLLRQEGNIIKGSLRTDPHKNFDVNKIARLFGGGGHKMASGFSVVGQLVKTPEGQWQIINTNETI
jgi:phosphoesterase RecJ-like protein